MDYYALDTNVIIHRLRGEPNVVQNFRNAAIAGHFFVIPRAVDYEIWRGFKITPAPKKESMYLDILNFDGCCGIVDMGESIWEISKQLYADLHKKSQSVGEIDILLAACCLHNDYTLVTSNTKHFHHINGLKLIDWTQPTK